MLRHTRRPLAAAPWAFGTRAAALAAVLIELAAPQLHVALGAAHEGVVASHRQVLGHLASPTDPRAAGELAADLQVGDKRSGEAIGHRVRELDWCAALGAPRAGVRERGLEAVAAEDVTTWRSARLIEDREADAAHKIGVRCVAPA